MYQEGVYKNQKLPKESQNIYEYWNRLGANWYVYLHIS